MVGQDNDQLEGKNWERDRERMRMGEGRMGGLDAYFLKRGGVGGVRGVAIGILPKQRRT
jgi:hypothetical protein